MKQKAIPFVMMRGGTSRGLYFDKTNLPDDFDALGEVLMAAIGAGHPLNIDGLGGGNTVTTKVAILSCSEEKNIDIEYLFAQVGVHERTIDFAPTCGNILCGVGAAAIELGLSKPNDAQTTLAIRASNTGALIETLLQTPHGDVQYNGSAAIDGVPGTAAPVDLRFKEIVGGLTGRLLPTCQPLDLICDIPVTCIDVAVPMVIARAERFGLTGFETPNELNENSQFMKRMETVRQLASKKMGLGNAAGRVTPKFGLLAPAREGGTATARYFVPSHAHPAMAVTGAQCLSACLLIPGSVGEGLAMLQEKGPTRVRLEHPSGMIDVVLNYTKTAHGLDLHSAGLTRTCRLLAKGHVFVPST